MRSLMLMNVAALMFLAASGAWTEDWSQFRGMHRDGKSPETGLLKEWPADGLKPLWIVEALGNGYSSVAVADGMLFTTGMADDKPEGVLTAVDPSGVVKWRVRYGPEWDQMHPGARSTPTLDGERLYELSGVGQLFCLDKGTGAMVWSRDLPKEFNGEAPRCGFAEAPLIYKDKAICTPGGKDAALVALDKATGKTIWTSLGFSDQSAYCSPILIDRGGHALVVTITARHVAGLDADSGKVVWTQPFDTTAEDPNHSVIPVYEDGRLYVTSGHREGGQMFELSPDGQHVTEKWADTILNNLHGGVVAVEGYLYGTNQKDKWVCLDFRTGTTMYASAGVGMGSLIFADGMLYCYGEKGTLGLAKASPKAFEVVSKFKVTQGAGPHWAHPVISGGRLYIRHGEVLIAFEIRVKQAQMPVLR